MRVGRVRAEGSGPDGALQVGAQSRAFDLDARQGGLDRPRHVHPGPLCRGAGGAIASAETDGRGQLMGDELQVLLCPRRAFGVVPRLRFLDLVAQLVEPLPVRCLGLRVEELADAAESADL